MLGPVTVEREGGILMRDYLCLSPGVRDVQIRTSRAVRGCRFFILRKKLSNETERTEE